MVQTLAEGAEQVRLASPMMVEDPAAAEPVAVPAGASRAAAVIPAGMDRMEEAVDLDQTATAMVPADLERVAITTRPEESESSRA